MNEAGFEQEQRSLTPNSGDILMEGKEVSDIEPGDENLGMRTDIEDPVTLPGTAVDESRIVRSGSRRASIVPHNGEITKIDTVVVMGDDCLKTAVSSDEKNTQEKWKHPSSSSSESSETSSEGGGRSCIMSVIKKNHYDEKFMYLASVITVIFLAYGLVSFPYMMPYYYAVSAPILICIKAIMYWKYNYQYFLLDFCYFGNAIILIYLWAFPDKQHVFLVVFGLANGPLAWAVWMFRNSLVLHSYDRMTSCYIHLLPIFVSYTVRWYPESLSEHWYSPFMSTFDLNFPFILIYLTAIPFAIYAFHNLCYTLIVFVCLKPDDGYLNSYRYITGPKSPYYFVVNCCGQKFQPLMYQVCYWSFCALSLAFTPLWYSYFAAHSVFIGIVFGLATWNGACWYMDVFGVKGHKASKA